MNPNVVLGVSAAVIAVAGALILWLKERAEERGEKENRELKAWLEKRGRE